MEPKSHRVPVNHPSWPQDWTGHGSERRKELGRLAEVERILITKWALWNSIYQIPLCGYDNAPKSAACAETHTSWLCWCFGVES